MKAENRDKVAWFVVVSLSAMLAMRIVDRGLAAGWRAYKKKDPPGDPAHRDTDWSEAVLWAVSTGAAAGIASVLASRGAAHGWNRVMGAWPPVDPR
jgi:hypothetical protein